jgi:hypothetical protein
MGPADYAAKGPIPIGRPTCALDDSDVAAVETELGAGSLI